VDRLDVGLSVQEKVRRGMAHAGASITITSLTNCIAFLLGSLTSLPALSSFCVFAGFGMLFDFVAELTIFSGFLVYDLKRQEKLKGDCCTLCRCSHKSLFCCRGRFLSSSQR